MVKKALRVMFLLVRSVSSFFKATKLDYNGLSNKLDQESIVISIQRETKIN